MCSSEIFTVVWLYAVKFAIITEASVFFLQFSRRKYRSFDVLFPLHRVAAVCVCIMNDLFFRFESEQIPVQKYEE